MTLQISTRQFWGMFAIAVVGLMDAVYLTVVHYTNAIPPCYVGSCETVLSSPYASILGVPVAVWGIVYYGTVITGLLWYQNTLSNRILQLTLLATCGGLLSSLYFFSLMAWAIQAWCQYCLLSGAVSLVLFILSVFVTLQSRHAA
jgi:uncharacterized membrane protein